jgi:hypothetical protein
VQIVTGLIAHFGGDANAETPGRLVVRTAAGALMQGDRYENR